MATIGEAEDLLGQVLNIEEDCDHLVATAGLSRKARALSARLIFEYGEEIESCDPQTSLSEEAVKFFKELEEAIESLGRK